MSRNCFSDIDSTICFEAPLRLDFLRSPRLAASAAPAAICCFFELAGILFNRRPLSWWTYCALEHRFGAATACSQGRHKFKVCSCRTAFFLRTRSLSGNECHVFFKQAAAFLKLISTGSAEEALGRRRLPRPVRSGRFPDQTTLPPSWKFGQRLTGQGIGAL